MKKELWLINDISTVIYSEIREGFNGKYQIVYDSEEQNTSTYDDIINFDNNIELFVKTLDINSLQQIPNNLTFPSCEVNGKYYTLDKTMLVTNALYNKKIFDTNDISNEELNWIIKNYRTIRNYMAKISKITQEFNKNPNW